MRAKHSTQRIRTLRRRRLALALVAAMAGPVAPVAMAQDLPTGGSVVVPGSASIGTSGNTMTITQNTQGAIINWGTFNISNGFAVNFAQPNTGSVVLNRVLGTLGSNINGALNANGRVFIVNTNGITFGFNSQVNVGGLVASTLAISDADFNSGVSSGSFRFSGFSGQGAQVRNDGTITAGRGGVGLVGPSVWNAGTIRSNGGNIAAGAGTTVTLDFVGDGLTQVTINGSPAIDSSIVQEPSSSMIADGGRILLRSATTANGGGGGIFASGLLRAQTVGSSTGRVELTSNGLVVLGAPGAISDANSPLTAGSIDVSGDNSERGGSVLIAAGGVILPNEDDTPFSPQPTGSGYAASVINASGGLGGGTVGIISNGDVFASAGTEIRASGTYAGDGGTVQILSVNGSAQLHGDIVAQGGLASGDGGRIQVGAAGNIYQFNGGMDASASAGNGGQLVFNAGSAFSAQDLWASGSLNGGSISASAGYSLGLSGSANARGDSGNGGSIMLTSDGPVYVSGGLDASGGVNGGSIAISGTARPIPVTFLTAGGAASSSYAALVSGQPPAVTVSGNINASGGSGNGGSVDLAGSGAVAVYGGIDANGGTNGGDIRLRATDGTYAGAVFVGGSLEASGKTGNGGLIDVYASAGAIVYGDMLATGGVDGGDISITGTYVYFESAIAYGDTGVGGSVAVTADDIVMYNSSATIDVRGETGGGSIDLFARNNLVLGEYSSLSADTGSSGVGGSIRLYGGNSLMAYGSLSARGVDGGGSIYTGSGGGITLNGIDVDAGTTSGDAGVWTIAAPQLTVVNGSQQGYVSEGSYSVTTTDIQDGDLNNAFATGTSIVLQANAGSVDFDDAEVVAAFSSPLFLHVNATGAITGGAFSISSTGGPLDMLFNANSGGANAGGGYIDFTNGVLSSAGGQIALYGQSDVAGGFASGVATGISLDGMDIDSGGGAITLRGASTGAQASTADAGVRIQGSSIASQGGNVDIQGVGAGTAQGVLMASNSIGSGGGALSIMGEAGNDGIRMFGSDIDSGGGDLTIIGVGGDDGIYASSTNLYSGGGAIVVHGDGGTGDGLHLSGAIDSDGGDISLSGDSAGATGLVFGGYGSGIVSAGGNIALTGSGLTGGVELYAGGGYSYANALTASFTSSDVGTINSGGGQLTVTGTASGVDAVGVLVDGFELIGGAGDVTVDGSAPQGTGVLFTNGAGITTTSGAITVIGTGANIGLDMDMADGTLTTDTGDIGLFGYALAATATAGVHLAGSGLATNGGNVTIHGESAGGVGVDLGDGSGFAISTSGGDIDVSGIGVTAGVRAPSATFASGGGDIAVAGTGGTAGVLAGLASFNSAGGDIAVSGTGSATGVDVTSGTFNSGTGDIAVSGTGGNSGVLANLASFTSAGGAIALAGTGSATGVDVRSGTFASGGGDIAVSGTGGTAGVLASLASFNSAGGAIALSGTGSATGLDVSSGTFTSSGGTITLFGQGDTVGVLANGANVSSGNGAIAITGSGAGTGVNASAGTFNSTGGNITLLGQGDTVGVLANGATFSSGTGSIAITGTGAGTGVMASFASFTSGGGSISILGQGGTGPGTSVSGPIDSAGGDVTLQGTSNSGVGLVYVGEGGGIASHGGTIRLTGTGVSGGVALFAGGSQGQTPPGSSAIDSGGGLLTVTGTASGAGGIGVSNSGMQLLGGSGNVTVTGTALLGSGILFGNGAGIRTTSGAISLFGQGAQFGLDVGDGLFQTQTGNITLDGRANAANATAGVRMAGSGLATNGGTISILGNSAGGAGVLLGNGGAFSIASGGGNVTIDGTGVTAGVSMRGNQVATSGGALAITGRAAGAQAVALDLTGSQLSSGSGSTTLSGTGTGAGSSGLLFGGGASASTTTGNILMTGIGDNLGLSLDGSVQSTSGSIDLRGRGTGTGASGLLIGARGSVATGGQIQLSGEGTGGAGLASAAGSSVSGGGLVVVRAANNGSSDAIRLQGTLRSDRAVNLRAGGVDANGGVYERVGDTMVVGADAGGFSLSASELALVSAPDLVIGSALHGGAIQVRGAVSRAGNLTLQNEAGPGGIDIQSPLNVGNGTLALSTGGSITQTAAGAITARSLLAMAGGDVLLATAQNDVASTTLAGTAGGQFRFLDANDLSIGSVSAVGVGANGLSTLAATGIRGGGNVFVRNLVGDLLLNADVTGANIDLVTAGRLQNPSSARLLASGNWRVWANTWVGETRGGLAGSGNLPNLYGCAFLGACGVTVPSTGNHFIYVQQPTATITFNNATREYGLPNPLLTFSVTGAILGDTAANVASGTASTTATIGSDVGNYPITGAFTSAAGYRIQLVPGTLAITPATLFFTANGAVRYLGTPNPLFTGTVTGFRNGDTLVSVFGTDAVWSSPAGLLSPVGFYPINGGTTARNYVFVQAPGNATALQVIPLPQLPGTPTQIIRETVDTYVYDRNFGSVPMCALNASLEDQQLASSGDELSTEWSKVRSRPNLTNCFESERRNSCGDF